jgi:acyl carrier protein
MDSTFEELDIDTLDSVELISDLEDHYNVSITIILQSVWKKLTL